jgi:anti-sigma factor RsiW
MNCSEVRESLAALVYGDLGPDKANAVRQHLAGCAGCREVGAGLEQVRGLLDAVPAPLVRVDLPRLYAEAARRQERRLRRWRRAALVALSAAALVLLAFGLSLQIRLEGHQVVVRWGAPPPLAEPSPPNPQVPLVALEPAAVTAEDIQLVKKLIHALAADVHLRDREQREAIARLQNRLEALDSQSQGRWTALGRDVLALYTAQFGPANQGERK